MGSPPVARDCFACLCAAFLCYVPLLATSAAGAASRADDRGADYNRTCAIEVARRRSGRWRHVHSLQSCRGGTVKDQRLPSLLRPFVRAYVPFVVIAVPCVFECGFLAIEPIFVPRLRRMARLSHATIPASEVWVPERTIASRGVSAIPEAVCAKWYVLYSL